MNISKHMSLSSPMAFLEQPLLREPLDSEDKVGSDPETKEESLDIELGTIHKLNKPFLGQWLVPRNPDYCCIYRVPTIIRNVNPEAYTPQMLIIGPLHHSLISQVEDATTTKLMNYLNMEELKKINLSKFVQRVEGENTIDEFRRIIQRNEERIRASYSESTAWIEYAAFVDMILRDSVFILEFILKTRAPTTAIEGFLMSISRTELIVIHLDLMFLENQLPYFILEELFEPIISKFVPDTTFRELVIQHFGFTGKIKNNSTFRHFTDLYRLVHLETLPASELYQVKLHEIEAVHNAYNLDSGGVKLEVRKEFSLHITFENGCLKIPFLEIHGAFEMRIRNIMAFEQSHDPYNAHVCNCICFMVDLIDTHKDVELLCEKGILVNELGNYGSVAEMFNKIYLGIPINCSRYSNIAIEVNAYYSNPVNKSLALLKRVYFGNLWTGTATVAATILLLMTLIQTITSIMQVIEKK